MAAFRNFVTLLAMRPIPESRQLVPSRIRASVSAQCAGQGGALHGMEVPSSHAAQQGTLGVECEEALKSALREPQVELVLSRLRATHQLSIEATRCVRSVFMPRTLPAMYESQHALRSPPQVRSNSSSARVL